MLTFQMARGKGYRGRGRRYAESRRLKPSFQSSGEPSDSNTVTRRGLPPPRELLKPDWHNRSGELPDPAKIPAELRSDSLFRFVFHQNKQCWQLKPDKELDDEEEIFRLRKINVFLKVNRELLNRRNPFHFTATNLVYDHPNLHIAPEIVGDENSGQCSQHLMNGIKQALWTLMSKKPWVQYRNRVFIQNSKFLNGTNPPPSLTFSGHFQKITSLSSTPRQVMALNNYPKCWNMRIIVDNACHDANVPMCDCAATSPSQVCNPKDAKCQSRKFWGTILSVNDTLSPQDWLEILTYRMDDFLGKYKHDFLSPCIYVAPHQPQFLNQDQQATWNLLEGIHLLEKQYQDSRYAEKFEQSLPKWRHLTPKISRKFRNRIQTSINERSRVPQVQPSIRGVHDRKYHPKVFVFKKAKPTRDGCLNNERSREAAQAILDQIKDYFLIMDKTYTVIHPGAWEQLVQGGYKRGLNFNLYYNGYDVVEIQHKFQLIKEENDSSTNQIEVTITAVPRDKSEPHKSFIKSLFDAISSGGLGDLPSTWWKGIPNPWAQPVFDPRKVRIIDLEGEPYPVSTIEVTARIESDEAEEVPFTPPDEIKIYDLTSESEKTEEESSCESESDAATSKAEPDNGDCSCSGKLDNDENGQIVEENKNDPDQDSGKSETNDLVGNLEELAENVSKPMKGKKSRGVLRPAKFNPDFYKKAHKPPTKSDSPAVVLRKSGERQPEDGKALDQIGDDLSDELTLSISDDDMKF